MMLRIWFERSLPPQYARLLEGVAVFAGSATETPQTPLRTLPGSHAIVASSRIRYDGALMDQVPSLCVISRTGIGVDNILIPDATARGIAVCNAPQAPTISTAEHAIALLLAVAKQLTRIGRKLRVGDTKDFFAEHTGLEVNGLRLGLGGTGTDREPSGQGGPSLWT